MPHLTIEYSGNLEAEIDIAGLCETLRRALAETELFALAGIRVRAYRCDHWSIADGDSFHGFIDMSLRIRSGRPLENRKAATAHLFAAAEGFPCTLPQETIPFPIPGDAEYRSRTLRRKPAAYDST